VSAVASFLFIPYHPLWSVLLIPVDMLVIWALAVYRPETGGVAHHPTPPTEPPA
jgi:hypothetical protein